MTAPKPYLREDSVLISNLPDMIAVLRAAPQLCEGSLGKFWPVRNRKGHQVILLQLE